MSSSKENIIVCSFPIKKRNYPAAYTFVRVYFLKIMKLSIGKVTITVSKHFYIKILICSQCNVLLETDFYYKYTVFWYIIKITHSLYCNRFLGTYTNIQAYVLLFFCFVLFCFDFIHITYCNMCVYLHDPNLLIYK